MRPTYLTSMASLLAKLTSIVCVLVLAAAFPKSASAQSEIYYNQLVGVFSASEPVRLDIGSRATKVNVPASHESWATRLRIVRLDGPSNGTVSSGHVVGIFSEDGQWRLDIGTRAMKENVPASHNSWATQLVLKRLDGASAGPAHYGDLVGFFSQDRQYRLDIGDWAMKENVPASHESWATQLIIIPQ